MQEPSLQKMCLGCMKCKYEWAQTIIVGVVATVAIAFWETIECPKCNAPWGEMEIITGPRAFELIGTTTPVKIGMAGNSPSVIPIDEGETPLRSSQEPKT
jgi:hypothetical protein